MKNSKPCLRIRLWLRLQLHYTASENQSQTVTSQLQKALSGNFVWMLKEWGHGTLSKTRLKEISCRFACMYFTNSGHIFRFLDLDVLLYNQLPHISKVTL